MEQAARERITLVEVLERTAPFDVFTATIQAAVQRLETEGVSTLLSIQFHARPEDTEVGAVITFADSRRVMEHIRMISGWPEFKALLGVARPVDVRVYGRLGEEAQAWLRTMNVVSKVFESPVAGFVR
ncbi:hypothetical protein D7W79_05020 [Corallococcus exercitus]|uniref:Uncharacterized protein n=1 Tax=Corallococcus exercitus TaxID=2316736 RepID=A0A3A8IE08_9BACT|nr:hypothetical protein [Corallococcus exercitus]NOK37809.1 hypothetical protein [Corallococcus exercitus]RKG81552.1 hypothetical protein D7W79_05020 [Corallococcus exercitus]